MKFQSPRGTRDLLFEQAELFSGMEAVCARVFALYGYSPIRTPHFESVELFKRSIGEETDIVEKEMFVFEDPGGRQLALRPEGTAPAARAYIENGLYSRGDVTRLYYTGPMFRAERPQAGRYREFWQAGAECFGVKDPSADADVIALLDDLLKSMSSNERSFSIHLNSLGCSECRPKFRQALERFLQNHKDKLCEDCRRRMVKNPLRVLDCKIDADKFLKAPTPQEFLCGVCREHFERVQKFLRDGHRPFEVFPRLMRGLDYYTGTVFEVVSEKLGAQNALAAGGRYDTLVSDLGGPPTPAVGFAIGLDRVAEALTPVLRHPLHRTSQWGTTGVVPPTLIGRGGMESGVFVVVLGEEAASVGFHKLAELRGAGIACPGLLPDKSLKAQMRAAGSSGARWAVILGDQELQEKVAMVKDLSNGSQQKVPLDGLVQSLRNSGPVEKAQ
jgi:histidyl-tRNA synthetase